MTLTNEEFDAYRMEIATFGNIPISSQPCGVGCVFCKVNNDATLSRFPALPQIDEDDLRRGFEFVSPNVRYVRIGAGVLVAPHTDPYLHPKVYDFIKITAAHFPSKKVTTVTTGSYVDVDKLSFLNGIPNFGIDLSLLTLQNSREKIMALPTRETIDVILREAPLNKVTLMFTGEINDLIKDLETLYSLGVNKRARQILVRRIEHTKESGPKLLSISRNSINGYENAISFLNKNYPEVVYTVPYLKNSYRGGNNEYFVDAEKRVRAIKEFVVRNSGRRICVICAESGFDYFTQALAHFPNVTTHCILNHLYGGSVTVAGLLNHPDIKEQFTWSKGKCDVIVLPGEMYNADECDITGEKRKLLAEHYGAEVCVI